MSSNKPRKIGVITEDIIVALKLSINPGTPILVGQSNINHMKSSHPEDYRIYGTYLVDIVNNPTYVAKNPNSGSIEFIKEFSFKNDHVLVAVRATASGVYFARSLYVMNKEKVRKYQKKGYMIRIN